VKSYTVVIHLCNSQSPEKNKRYRTANRLLRLGGMALLGSCVLALYALAMLLAQVLTGA
jgi:hypothetical protein